MAFIFGKGSPETKQDYVICWYKAALDYMNNCKSSSISAAFVSTDSICQGESVPTFWRRMIDNGAIINFAYHSFEWKSEATEKAMVYCVIVGFSNKDLGKKKCLFDETRSKEATHINGYLQNAPDVWIANRSSAQVNSFPKMVKGSEPTDGGNLFLSPDERTSLIARYPVLERYIRPFIGGKEFLGDKVGTFSRYCFWFKGGNPSDFVHISEIQERLDAIKRLRLASSADRIRNSADYPYLFAQIRQPESLFLVFPRHSSGDRKYIPIGFQSPDVIVGDACSIVPSAGLYEFGVLTSNVHMAWTNVVCGRLGRGYRYSPLVYNNFPVPNPTEEQKARIEDTARGILEARLLNPNSCLSDLYNELAMPVELRKAHQENDKAVMEAYGFNWRTMTESDCVAELFKLYQKLTEK